ncbi:MAG TPA: hypothetical protein VFY27_01590, partial [Woeseiaceae bacterium]|nr:hypothetical protein [Woeseiaceae bacterium]
MLSFQRAGRKLRFRYLLLNRLLSFKHDKGSGSLGSLSRPDCRAIPEGGLFLKSGGVAMKYLVSTAGALFTALAFNLSTVPVQTAAAQE